MKKSRIAVQFILGLFLLALLAVGGCGSSDDAPIPGFYTISGTVTVGGSALPNVTITLSGAATGTTTTDASGNYSFTGLLNGAYTVTPSLTGYTLNPSSRNPTIAAADITGQDFVATITFAQADLEGTWHINVMKSRGEWFRATVDIDKDGALTMSGCMADDGPPEECPSGVTMTMGDNGVITINGYDGAHYTMTLNKNFIAGTLTGDGEELDILQKVPADPSAVYHENDVNNKTFVMHQLFAGGGSIWAHGEGYTKNDGKAYFKKYIQNGTIVIDSDTGVEMGVTLTLDPVTGLMTSSELESLEGFLSEDKKTGVVTVFAEVAQLIIFQFTGDCDNSGVPTTSGNFTVGPISAGIYSSHILGIQNDASSGFWVHSLFTVDNLGKSIFDPLDWVTSDVSVTAPIGDDYISIMSPTGTVKTSLSNSYHGQMSADGMFIVYTNTNTYDENTFCSIGIDIRTNGVIAAEVK